MFVRVKRGVHSPRRRAPPPPAPPLFPPLDTESIADEIQWQVRLLRLTGMALTRCPPCNEGRMVPHPLDDHGVQPTDMS